MKNSCFAKRKLIVLLVSQRCHMLDQIFTQLYGYSIYVAWKLELSRIDRLIHIFLPSQNLTRIISRFKEYLSSREPCSCSSGTPVEAQSCSSTLPYFTLTWPEPLNQNMRHKRGSESGSGSAEIRSHVCWSRLLAKVSQKSIGW